MVLLMIDRIVGTVIVLVHLVIRARIDGGRLALVRRDPLSAE
jgi:hypothetical protein